MGKNALVAQSGGPSPVINASLQGVIDACRAYPDSINTLYAAHHGIEGVLLEELIDLYAQPEEELARLKYTPASGAIGTCLLYTSQGPAGVRRVRAPVCAARGLRYDFVCAREAGRRTDCHDDADSCDGWRAGASPFCRRGA